MDIQIDWRKNNFNRQSYNLGYKDSFTWTCLVCGKQNNETEARNFDRRKIKCICQQRYLKAQKMNKELQKVNYKFLFEDGNYQLSKKIKDIDNKQKIKVQCLKCGKVSEEYYYNILKKHKTCNCNEKKAFTRDISREEFINKWSDFNKKNFELLDEKYINRNTVYHIKCKKCGKEDTRWGITLIDKDTHCKYCSLGSNGEIHIGQCLDELKIHFIREYKVIYNKHVHYFDFYLPEQNIIIEYNGEQHYKPVEYFGGEDGFKRRQERDLEKQLYCKENDIKLLIFNYNESLSKIKEKLSLMFND